MAYGNARAGRSGWRGAAVRRARDLAPPQARCSAARPYRGGGAYSATRIDRRLEIEDRSYARDSR
jgi:hypothetical protein